MLASVPRGQEHRASDVLVVLVIDNHDNISSLVYIIKMDGFQGGGCNT